MKKIGIIHTTPATVAGLKQLIAENIKDATVINILDDSILPDMINQNAVPFVEKRWIGYAKTLAEMGADVILSACSTVGEIAEACNKQMELPVLRIDEAMAESAIAKAESAIAKQVDISVLATLATTLEPTIRLIERKAKDSSAQVKLRPILVEGAYQALQDGDMAVHDAKIRQAIRAALKQSPVLVLAQASMAAAWGEREESDRILTSPVLGIKRLKQVLETQ